MIILQMHAFCRDEDLTRIHGALARQIESGLLLLPPSVSFVHANTNNNETVSILTKNGEIIAVDRIGTNKEISVVEDGTPILGDMTGGSK